MTQEEKAKRYDEAIEKLRSLHDDYDTVSTLIDIKEELENIFPELKESEDERVRKAMIDFFKHEREEGITVLHYGVNIERMIAWLEKQGEHANFRNKIQIGDKVTRNEAGILVNISQLNRVAKKREKQDEQKPTDKVEPRFKVGDIISNGTSEVKIIEVNDNSYSVTNDEIENDCNLSNWVVYFKDQEDWELVEQNPAWSEEDKNRINHLIAYFEDKESFTAEDDVMYANWLKSLKERYTWKPSNR
jgi:hypothetical protein